MWVPERWLRSIRKQPVHPRSLLASWAVAFSLKKQIFCSFLFSHLFTGWRPVVRHLESTVVFSRFGAVCLPKKQKHFSKQCSSPTVRLSPAVMCTAHCVTYFPRTLDSRKPLPSPDRSVLLKIASKSVGVIFLLFLTQLPYDPAFLSWASVASFIDIHYFEGFINLHRILFNAYHAKENSRSGKYFMVISTQWCIVPVIWPMRSLYSIRVLWED